MSADLIVDDTGTIMRITCTRKRNGIAIDLTGATVYICWIAEDGTEVKQQMAISDAANGQADYQFGVGELYANFMSFEFEINDAGGEVMTSLELHKQIVRDPIVA